MNSIPLIKGNTPQEINTSIISLKKALAALEGNDKDVQNKIKQINELIEGINTHLGTVDTHLTAIDGQITALQPVNTVTNGDMHSVTSNVVFKDKYLYTNYERLSSVGWYKIAELGKRNIGSLLSIDLFSLYTYTPSCSHKIQINYGWLNVKVVDIANDASGIFDKIKICYNSNNTDIMAIYVHYNKSQSNGVFANINGASYNFTPFNFTTDSKDWDNTIESNLGINGIYENGLSLSPIQSVEVDYGDITMSLNNYLQLNTSVPSEKTIIGFNVTHWHETSGGFTLMPYNGNLAFVIANQGVTITELKVKWYYI